MPSVDRSRTKRPAHKKRAKKKASTGNALETAARPVTVVRATKKKKAGRHSNADRRREAVNRYRQEMRKQGMRLVQFWAPDTSAPGFEEECRRQSLLAAADHQGEAEIMAELEANRAEVLKNEPDFDWGPQGPPK